MFGWKVIKLYFIDNLPISGTSARAHAITGEARQKPGRSVLPTELGPVEWVGTGGEF